MSNRFLGVAALLPALLLPACGGKVIFDEPADGEGGGGAAGVGGDPSTGTTSPTTATTNSSSTGTIGCDDISDCGANMACLFGTGECVPRCGFDLPCPGGMVCNDCATSSCPSCKDCVSACLPAPPAQCDEHADCGSSIGEDVCVFFSGECAQRCGPGSPPCPPQLACDPCATSSCPGCDDCLGACVMQFK